MEEGTLIRETKYVAGKPWQWGDRVFKTGDPVDVSELPDHKIVQFLNHRMLKPAPPEPSEPHGLDDDELIVT
jgi:hypothetical protein